MKTSSFVLCGPRFHCLFVRIRQQTSYAQGRFRQYHRKSQRRQIDVDERTRRRTPLDHHLQAQTTRHRILGVVSGEDFQIVFSDTPGILKPSYKLQESMMKFVTGAVNDADVILYVTDTVEQSDRSNDILEKIRQSDIPTLAVINKIDLTTPEKLEELVDKWQALLPAATIVPVSARENFNIKGLFDLILERLPEGEAFYSKDTLTDKTLRFFASEIIREKILRNYDKEIPYCCEIAIEAYKEEPTIDRISAVIYVARDSQKGILIGHKGEKLKKSDNRPART